MKDTILVVDDEEDIREVLQLSLLDMGYQVLLAENGRKGFELFRDVHPAIVLTDIKMPGMDGIQLLTKIKNQDPDAEVIMITGHGDMDLAIKSFQHDAVEFITKPVNVKALKAALKKIRDKVRIREQLRAYTHQLEWMLYQKYQNRDELEKKADADPLKGELFTAKATFQKFFDKMPFYITVQKPNLRLSAVNRQFKADYGDKSGEFCYQIYLGWDLPCPDCPVLKTFKDGKAHQTDKELKLPDGTPYTAFLWTTPVSDHNGRITPVLSMLTNIAQVLDVQDHLSTLGLMISSLSHGIKGLLTGLDSGLYMLDSGLSHKDFDRIGEGLDIVRKLMRSIRQMVMDILFYAKEREIKTQRTDLKKLTEETCGIVRKRIREFDIDFSVTCDLQDVFLQIDANCIQTALINILENAIDACIAEDAPKNKVITFKVWRTEEKVIFDISDNGIGMAEDVKAKTFFAFLFGRKKKRYRPGALYQRAYHATTWRKD